jgi:uncharacterized RDD family membrane protein YckC
MTCPGCSKEILPDTYFCNWCGSFVPSPAKGTKPGLFRRWFALVIDPVIAIVLYFLGVSVFSAVSEDLGIAVALILPLLYIGWFLSLLRQGLTPGKKLMGLQVVDQQTGQIPGFGKMFVREIVGRFISGLFFGLGYLWAIIDKSGQAWHDKIANTVVVKRRRGGSVALPPNAGMNSSSEAITSRTAN